MIREQVDYNQVRLFIRYVVGRKSPQKLISFIGEQFLFHKNIKLAETPDGITLRVATSHGDAFVPLGPSDNPTCVVYLSIIGATMFASSHNTYVKRIDFVKHLRLKESKSLKPELEVLIPNMAPYIKRLNERVGYKMIRNRKIGREAGYSFETDNFRANMLVPYFMDKRKFTSCWSKGNKVIFFTSPGCSSDIIEALNEKNIWTIPVYEEKEMKGLISKYKPKLILFDYGKSLDAEDLFGYVEPPIKEPKLPLKYFALKDDGAVEFWGDSEDKRDFSSVEDFCKGLSGILKKMGEKGKG